MQLYGNVFLGSFGFFKTVLHFTVTPIVCQGSLCLLWLSANVLYVNFVRTLTYNV